MPNNAEAERALLGSVILDLGALDIALELGVAPEDFYREAHGLLFQRMIDLGELGQAIDFVTLGEVLSRDGCLEKAGGAGYIASLTDGVPIGTTAAVGEYSRIVKEKSTLRRAIHVASNLMARALEGADDSKTLIEMGQQQFFELAEERVSTGFVTLRQAMQQSFGTIDRIFERGGTGDGVETGFIDLDGMLGCLRNQEFIVVAARPSVGKTAWALNVAAHVAMKQQKGVGIFSLEMARSELVLRMLCSEAQVDSHKLRTGFASKDDWGRMTAALGRLAEARIYIDDTPGISIMEMRAKARRLVAEHDVALIIADYLQLIRGTGENRTQEVSNVSHGLLNMARELKRPVVAISQLSRPPEQRRGPKPMLSDLRESGAIEQDAHTVIFLFRFPPKAFRGEPEDEELGITEGVEIGVNIAKQRNGPVGDATLMFLRPYVKFENRAVAGFDYDAKAAAAGPDR